MDTPQDPPRRDDPSVGPVEPAVDAALDRVHALLRQARVTAAPDAPTALDARGWWELSLEAALRDEPRESARLADSGLAALVPGQDDVRLALLRALAVAAGQVGDEAALTRWAEARAALLRHLGRPRQAGLESQLGAALVRDPDTVEAAVLAGVVEDEPGAPGEDPGDTVLPEAALALAVHRVHTGDLDAALELARRVIAVLGGLRAAGALLPTGSWSSAHLLLARLHLWRGEHAEADAAAVVVTALPLWREAAGLFEAHGQWEDAARTLLAAGALVNRERDERTRPSALDLFERAVAAARQAVDEDPAVLPAALHAHGYLLCESGQAEGLDLLEEALALVRDAGADWQVADYTDTRARALWSLERGPEAIATALQAADLFTAAGDREGTAQAELFAAYVVAEDGSPEQAATLFRLVCDSTDSTLVRLGALTGLHQCLSALGDHDGAARVRDELDALRKGLGAD